MANMRISGLASGMDIDSIVSDMMKIKRMPLDKLKQQKQTMEWQRDDYREMNTLLLNFRSELTQMKLSTKYRTRTTTTTDESKVTATASSAAALSSYSIQSVSQLATAATKVNKETISNFDTDKIVPTKSLFEQGSKFKSTGFNWNFGSVESTSFTVKDLTAATATTEVSLGLHNGVKLITTEAPNVKVNGVSFKITNSDPINDGEVFVNSDGTLKFKTGAIKVGDTIKVDYIADKRVDEFTFKEATTSLSLSKGSLSSVEKITVGTTDYTVSIPSAESGNELWNILDTDKQTVIGKINLVTGKITDFNKIQAGSNVVVTYKQNYTSFSIQTYNTDGNPVTENFNIEGTESLNNLINKVNSSNVGVSMFYDSFSDRVTLSRTETGDFKKVDPNDSENKDGYEIVTSGDFINKVLQFEGGTETGGQNAKFKINGLDTERNSNTLAVNGVTFSLKQIFSDDTSKSNYAPPVTVAINNNNDEIFNNIKSFIEKYNELIGKIQEKTQEERYKSYTPLTDEQREQLSDKQQEQWEEKAQSGLLRRDQTLTSLLSSMRMDFYGKVESEKINPVYSQLASIGIKTTANYLEGGKLEINEAELKKTIEEDPESIEALFNASGTTTTQKGIAQRLYDTVGKTMDILYEKAGKSYSTNNQFTIGKQLNNIDDQIDSLEDRLSALEDRYYRQFTAMEKAIQNANQQSAYITQNFFS